MSVVAEVELVTGLPDGWTRRKLGEVCRLWNGRAYKKEELLDQGRYVVLRVGNFFTNDRWYYSDLELEAEKYCDDGDLLYAWSASFGPRIWAGGKVIYHYHIWKITLEDELIDKDFLFHFLDWDAAQIKSSMGSGSTMIHVTKGAMEQRAISLPPLDEQRRIAEVLRSVDEAIGAAQEAADHASVVQSLLTTDRCFGQGFDMVSLGDIMTDIRYGTSVKCDASAADGYPVLRIPNVVNGRVELDDLKYAAVSDADLRRFSLDQGDVVVVRTNGNPAYIGRSALIEDGTGQFLFASYLIRMRFDERSAWAPYVFAALNSKPVRQALLKAATTSAGNYNINTKSLNSIAIPLPDIETQHQISEAIRAATDAASACESEVRRKRRIKADVMSNLLSGRVRVHA